MSEPYHNYLRQEIQKPIVIHSLVTLIDAYRAPDYYFQGEQHDFWEMVYVVSGSVGITADDHIYTLSAGDIVFHKPMEFHKIWSYDQTSPHVYILSFEAEGEGLQKLENRTFRLSEQDKEALKHLVGVGKSAFSIEDNAENNIEENGRITDILDANKAQIYCNLLELFLLSLEDRKIVKRNKDENAVLFSRIMQILNDNLYQQISIPQVADACFISTSKLKKLFHLYTGMGLIAYHSKMKIQKACDLIAEGHSVAEISAALGYSSPFYFSNVFKKEMGISPTEYRRSL